MKRKLLSLLCALALLTGILPAAAALEGETARAADTLYTLHVLEDANYRLEAPATRGQAAVLLVNLSGGKWAARSAQRSVPFRDIYSIKAEVGYGVSQGWFSGVSATEFSPDSEITANAWCTFLLRMLGYSDKAGDFAVSDAAAFARRIGLLSRTYTGMLSRAELFQSAVEVLTFSYKDGSGTVVEKLISSGTCTRAAANALGLLDEALTARQVADRHTAAVFSLNGFDNDQDYVDNKPTHEASGFFITPDGIAVTNYHSIEGCLHAYAILGSGERYPVERVLWYDAKMDLAVLRVSRTSKEDRTTSAFASLDLVGTKELHAGDIVYTLGNPLALGLAVSSGIVSDPARHVDRYSQPCVMNTADISQGSSGGALLNVYGHVIAVTSGAYSLGNNMYLAVPVDPILNMDLTVPGSTLREIVEQAKTSA